ncbi:ABC transporter substrate-binding protein [Deinococcus peraridilitoris]|uniref:ABC-type Fe3+-hydroxamate transport system, periplasmic component n=1 Tax=Deinococcus peraridilitoris (strain DSM 19664 / LMG 22246 / CIP 109416 / KR-200) TaxID=937777 RepID=L0A7V5_DEIPD|nr:ABC transporter substrate-binding protein [Deinococcus peraridilitoris]AFZ69267.1 ABC-type Fe3+-hydroxamate transport system, periplasmic component [Deinococcus peraridilitoris DSM 19664]
MNTKRAIVPLAILTLTATLAHAQSNKTIMVQHDEGTTKAPVQPKRVIVLDEESLELALALGFDIIGLGSGRLAPTDVSGTRINFEALKQGFLARRDLTGVTYTGNWTAPNLETILALKPELILRSTWNGNTGYDKLSAIAPTLSFNQNKPDFWKTSLRETAKVFGQQDKAEQIIQNVALEHQKNKDKLQQAGIFKKYPKAVVLSPFPSGEVYLYTGDRVANIAWELGFKDGYPRGTKVDPGGWQVISQEALLQITPDTLVINVPWGDGNAFSKSSVGQRLKDRTITYQMEPFSPWTGPLVDQKVSRDLTSSILKQF